MVSKIYNMERGVKMELNHDSCLRNGLLSPVWVCLCVFEMAACNALESLEVSWYMVGTCSLHDTSDAIMKDVPPGGFIIKPNN